MFDGPEPIFVQIANHVRHQILSGQLTAGDQIPSTTQFSKAHKINPATVVKGYALLVDEGLVAKRRGVGMFVTEQARQDITDDQRTRFFVDHVDPMLYQATLLDIPLAEIVDYLNTR